MTLADRVVSLLTTRSIAHALIGAAALAAHGIARSTYDIDVLVADARVLDPDLWDELRASGVVVEIRRGDADDPLGGVVRLEAPGERPVDLVLGKHAWHSRALERAERPRNQPAVVAARDLVLLKLYAGGTRDLWDVRELLQLPDAARLIEQVEADLAVQSDAMRERWMAARR